MRLTDVYVNLMAYVAYFARCAAKNNPPYERVAADIHRLIEDIRGKMNRGEVSPEDGDPALFAVVAWVDETIMNSRWEHRGNGSASCCRENYTTSRMPGRNFSNDSTPSGLTRRTFAKCSTFVWQWASRGSTVTRATRY